MFANNYRLSRDGFLPALPTPLLFHSAPWAWFNTVSHESNISLYINYRQLKGEKMEWKVRWDGRNGVVDESTELRLVFT